MSIPPSSLLARASPKELEEPLLPIHGVLNALPSPQKFLQPTYPLYSASISAAKHYLDPLALTISKAQTTNREQKGRKRKRSSRYKNSPNYPLQLRELHIDGFTIGQVWEQAKRVLESSREGIEWDLAKVLANEAEITGLSDSSQENVGPIQFDHGADGDDESEISEAADDVDEEFDSSGADADRHPRRQNESPEERIDPKITNEFNEPPSKTRFETMILDPHGLNDGFFSIDDFNRQSELLENQDARGSPDADAASDEEDVYWDVDPLTASGKEITKTGLSTLSESVSGDGGHSEEGSADDDGPTFGDADLSEASNLDDDELSSAEVEGGFQDNTNAIKYSDFFAPPAVKSSSKRIPEPQPTPPAGKENIQKDIQVAMSDVRRDLFDSDPSDEEDLDITSPEEPRSRQSTHEKLRAKLADEIRRLETANVSKRDWTLSGEAKAPQRPLNSLIEEDLEFERVGKPVPVVTNEVTEAIEELVKRRIMAKEFDEVIRRHPDSLDTRSSTRRDKFQLDDTKPQQSLAELYETDHLRATDSGYIEPKDEKLKQEHLEISQLWKDINSQLDTLSNWHYKPKIPHANITVVADVPTVTMEDARPTAGRGVSGPGMLAPQEVYGPGNDGKFGTELTLKSGGSVAKHEMSREEKLRRRKREKQKMKKQLGNTNRPGGVSTRKDQLVSNLDKAGVKVIGKDGETKDVYGRKSKASAQSKRGDELKL